MFIDHDLDCDALIERLARPLSVPDRIAFRRPPKTRWRMFPVGAKALFTERLPDNSELSSSCPRKVARSGTSGRNCARLNSRASRRSNMVAMVVLFVAASRGADALGVRAA
jgi:hypothetical protein